MKFLNLFTVIILFGCGNTQKVYKEQNLEFTTLAQSALYGAGKEGITPGLYVIKDK